MITTSRGKFIAIEGTDGSGKATQLKKLSAYLESQNHQIATFDFPQYDKPSAHFVREYLNGNYGSFKSISPYKASIFFALDRHEAKKDMLESLSSGKIILSNRYVGSNMAHQGSNLDSPEDRSAYFKWIENLEFDILGIPKPDLSIILHVSATAGQKLVDMKEKRKYITTGAKRDILEESLEHLKRTESTYLEMAKSFPNQFTVIECMKGDQVMSIDEIHAKIVSKVKSFLS